jgi:hypothetical protein
MVRSLWLPRRGSVLMNTAGEANTSKCVAAYTQRLNEHYVPRRNRVYPWITSIALLDTFNVQLSWLAQAGSVQSRVIYKKCGPCIHVESTRPDLRRRNRSLRHQSVKKGGRQRPLRRLQLREDAQEKRTDYVMVADIFPPAIMPPSSPCTSGASCSNLERR